MNATEIVEEVRKSMENSVRDALMCVTEQVDSYFATTPVVFGVELDEYLFQKLKESNYDFDVFAVYVGVIDNWKLSCRMPKAPAYDAPDETWASWEQEVEPMFEVWQKSLQKRLKEVEE